MAAKGTDFQPMLDMLLNPACKPDQRLALLEQIVMHQSPETREVLVNILNDARAGAGEKIYRQKLLELEKKVQGLEQGPLRKATFMDLLEPDGMIMRAHIRMEDGTTAFPAVFEPSMAAQLRRGDNVLLDAQGKLLLAGMKIEDGAGESAILERRIGEDRVEVSVRGDERHIFYAAQTLIDDVERGDVRPGARVRVCPHQRLAFAALPEDDALSYYRYLDRSPVSDVIVERDLGDPPAYIDELARLVALEMTNPALRRRYGLPRCVMKLLAGISGSGKSYSIRALIRRVSEVVSDITGASMQELPPRVMRFRPSTMLSQWLGESDKNIARFFEEARKLSTEPFITRSGKEHTLPVFLILEEIDGLTRHRGGGDPVYDRILTTILELLDPTRPELKNSLVIILGTTNVAELIDMAFMRRIGGTVERFGRLSRRAFAAVLQKKLELIPFAGNGGLAKQAICDAAVSGLTSWLYSPNGETSGQVALQTVGSTTPQIYYRRDFMTAGLVDRAVQQAAHAACRAEADGCDNPGIATESIKRALDAQVRSSVGLLRVDNVARYLELPEGIRVQSVQPIKTPLRENFDQPMAA